MGWRRHYSRISILLTALVIVVACSGGPADDDPHSGRLTITGSSTVAPLVNEIAQRFEAENPDVRISVQTGGSSRGITDAARGTADIGMVSRGLTPSEVERLESHALGIDGIGFIVHVDNDVHGLQSGMIVDLFSGRVSNWKSVGGPERSVTVVNKADGRATLEVFLEHFELRRNRIIAAVIVGDNQHGIRTVAGDRGAISYVSIGAARHEIEQGTGIRLLDVDGVVPSLENVALGDYPIVRPLTLVIGPDASPLARRFVEYARAKGVHDLFREFGFVPSQRR